MLAVYPPLLGGKPAAAASCELTINAIPGQGLRAFAERGKSAGRSADTAAKPKSAEQKSSRSGASRVTLGFIRECQLPGFADRHDLGSRGTQDFFRRGDLLRRAQGAPERGVQRNMSVDELVTEARSLTSQFHQLYFGTTGGNCADLRVDAETGGPWRMECARGSPRLG